MSYRFIYGLFLDPNQPSLYNLSQNPEARFQHGPDVQNCWDLVL